MSDQRILVAQDSLAAAGENTWTPQKGNKMGFPILMDFYTQMAMEGRVFEKLSKDLPLCHKDWTDRGQDTSFWPFYMPRVIEWGGEIIYGSEDWALCHRAREAGFGIWLDPSIRLGHMGQVMFTLEDIIRPPRPDAQPLILRRLADGTIQTSTIQKSSLVTAKA